MNQPSELVQRMTSAYTEMLQQLQGNPSRNILSSVLCRHQNLIRSQGMEFGSRLGIAANSCNGEAITELETKLKNKELDKLKEYLIDDIKVMMSALQYSNPDRANG